MPKRKRADWARLRKLYEESALPVAKLAGRFGVGESTIRRRVAAEGWVRGRAAEVRREHGGMVGRLLATIDRKLAQLEARMEKNDDVSIGDHERETRAIGQLIRNFEKVTGLEGAEAFGATEPTRRGKESDGGTNGGDGDAERLRLELAERILRLRGAKRTDG